VSSDDLLTIHTDGASRGNPGQAAIAYTIARQGHPTIEVSECLGQATNNVAEYTALVRALRHALDLGADKHVVVHSDSELMVKQMSGEYSVKNEDLKPLYKEATALCGRFTHRPSIRHVRRAQNARADELCNEALDGRPRGRGRAVATTAPADEPSRPQGLHDLAVARLKAAAKAWTDRSPQAAGPDEVWQDLVTLLLEHGVKFPPK
jgi:ribonuclease HI